MSSDNARAHNNHDMKLANLFDVKDKVALVTGQPLPLFLLEYSADMNKAAARASA